MKKQLFSCAILSLLVLSGCKNEITPVAPVAPVDPDARVTMADLLDGYYNNFTVGGSSNLSVGDTTTGTINVNFDGENEDAFARFDSRGDNFNFTGYGNGSLLFDITIDSYGTANDGSAHADAWTPYVKVFIKDDATPGHVDIHDIDPANADSVNWDDRVAAGTKYSCVIPLNLITSEAQLTDSDGDGTNLAPWDFISFGGNPGNLYGMQYTVENITFSANSPSTEGGKGDGIKCHSL
ncbi:MAG: hypothetical protein ACJAS1_001792 [Oleiphilaceae bacterium]|jgi:hypothetical protein